jgi:hypothetical protein
MSFLLLMIGLAWNGFGRFVFFGPGFSSPGSGGNRWKNNWVTTGV